MRLSYSLLLCALCATVTIDTAVAQRGFGGDRGRDRGGDRGSERGGDRGRSWGGDRGGMSRGREGGRPDFDPKQMAGRIAGFMDRNQDGFIDPGELDRMPSTFKDRFKAAGIDPSRGISVKDFSAKTAESIQARIAERENGDGDRSSRRESRDDKGSTKTASGKTVFKQSERKKFNEFTLPEAYAEGDMDHDGQIALFEWAAWKRSDMFAFFELDENQDGFLTARELAEQEKDEQAEGIVFKRERLVVSSGSNVSGSSSRLRAGGRTSKVTTGPSRSPDDAKRDAAKASYYFSALDRDRDGMISEEEWARSRTVRGTLERAKIPIRPMSRESFIENYSKAAAIRAQSGDDERRDSDRGRSRGR